MATAAWARRCRACWNSPVTLTNSGHRRCRFHRARSIRDRRPAGCRIQRIADGPYNRARVKLQQRLHRRQAGAIEFVTEHMHQLIYSDIHFQSYRPKPRPLFEPRPFRRCSPKRTASVARHHQCLPAPPAPVRGPASADDSLPASAVRSRPCRRYHPAPSRLAAPPDHRVLQRSDQIRHGRRSDLLQYLNDGHRSRADLVVSLSTRIGTASAPIAAIESLAGSTWWRDLSSADDAMTKSESIFLFSACCAEADPVATQLMTSGDQPMAITFWLWQSLSVLRAIRRSTTEYPSRRPIANQFASNDCRGRCHDTGRCRPDR